MTRAAAALGLALVAGCLEAPPQAGGDGDRDRDAGLVADAAAVEGLVLWYRMDDVPPGGVVEDAVGLHPAVCDPCPGIVEGTIGSAFDFEGEHLSVEDSDALRTPAGTLSMWAQFDDVGTGVIVSRPIGEGIFNEVLLFIESGVVKLEAGQGQVLMADALVLEGSWVHLAATWSPQRHAIYLGGVLRGAFDSPAAFEYESVELLIGADRDNGDIAFAIDARLDDLRIYDRALADDEIAALAAGSPTGS